MICKILCFSLLIALAASQCVWDSSVCTEVLAQDIDDAVQEYIDMIGGADSETGALRDVLALDLECLWDACQAEDETEKAEGVEQCRLNAKMTVENQLQFVPSNFRDQLESVCTCGYGDLTNKEVGDVSIDSEDVESIYNCDVDLPGQQFCHNAPGLAFRYGVCNGPEMQQFIEEMKEKTREAMEVIRIGTFCKGEVESMVRGDKLLTPTCEAEENLRKTLTNRCDNKCFHNPQYLAINDKVDDPGFFVDYYSWYTVCEDGLGNVRDTSGKSAAVKMTEVCWEYLSTKKIPVQLQYPMYPASINTDDELTAALDDACTLDADEYSKVNYDDLQSDLGNVELKKMGAKGLALDYGFISSMRRAVLSKATGNCWEKKNPEFSHCSQDAFPDDCDEGMEKMDICENADLENFHWFLKYLDDASLEVALRACDAGAYFGKHILALPGMSTTHAAEKFARYEKNGTKMTAFLVFHDCAVAAAMKANNYFVDGSCNDNAMDITTVIY